MNVSTGLNWAVHAVLATAMYSGVVYVVTYKWIDLQAKRMRRQRQHAVK